LLQVKPQLADDGERLAGERLVELDQVDIGEPEAGQFQHLGNGDYWADAHDLRADAGDCEADEPQERLESELSGALALHNYHGCGAIAALGGVARGHRSADLERGAELRKAFSGGVAPRSLVALEDGLLLPGLPVVDPLKRHVERNDLRVEAAG